MKAMVLEAQRSPLIARELAAPVPGDHEVSIRVEACAVCRTDLHVADGDLTDPKLPLVLGHEIVGRVESIGNAVQQLKPGDRVGVPWLGWTCQTCRYCARGQENLCDNARFTGYQINGGYAQFTTASERFCFKLEDHWERIDAPHIAPLLCAGLIGWRSLKMAGEGKRLGLYGFGAAAHVIAQVALSLGKEIYAFTREGDTKGQEFARTLGAVWAGGSNEKPRVPLDAAIIFAPVGELVPVALRAVDKGGIVVCGGIHMSDIPAFPYDILWEEREIKSVANLTRADGTEFLRAAAQAKVETTITEYPLSQANEALNDLRAGKLHGAAVLVP